MRDKGDVIVTLPLASIKGSKQGQNKAYFT
jgi:hypothetical protein